jgi:hypothetical protein
MLQEPKFVIVFTQISYDPTSENLIQRKTDLTPVLMRQISNPANIKSYSEIKYNIIFASVYQFGGKENSASYSGKYSTHSILLISSSYALILQI